MVTLDFTDNVRVTIPKDDDELRKSLKEFRWIYEFPALVDENGLVLVGHRRLRLAEELHIEPVIKTLKLGKGDEADAERFKLALASNIGGAPLTKADRKHVAEVLYSHHNWTMQRIGEALGVTHETVSQDLKEFSGDLKTSRPKGGRPKGRRAPKPFKHEPEVEDRAATIVALLEQGLTQAEIAAKTEVPQRTVRRAIDEERLRRTAISEGVELEGKLKIANKRIAELEFDLGKMPTRETSAAYKQIAAERQKAEREAKRAARHEVETLPDEKTREEYERQIKALRTEVKNLKQLNKIITEERRRIDAGVKRIDKTAYKTIVTALHPDNTTEPILKKRLEAAFKIFVECVPKPECP